MGQCHQRIPLTIYHNWDNTISVMKKLMLLKQHASSEEFGYAMHYNLGAIGTLSEHTLSDWWYRLAGPAINKTMPWITEMLEMFSELDPDDGCISCMHGTGKEHIDLPHNKTALNYIFQNTDPAAYTWVKTDNGDEQYSSDVGSAWLLDAHKSHGIYNTGERWSLSIHFNQEYSVVKKWFDAHPNLVFGNNSN